MVVLFVDSYVEAGSVEESVCVVEQDFSEEEADQDVAGEFRERRERSCDA